MAAPGGNVVPTWILLIAGFYYGTEFVMLKIHHILTRYEPDEDGYYQLEYWVSEYRWKMTNNRSWMTLHAICNSMAFFCFLLQLSPTIRSWNINFHKAVGKVALAFFFVGMPYAPIAAFDMLQINLLNRCIVSALGLAAMAYAVGGVIMIKRKEVGFHKQYMLRMFMCSANFVLSGRAAIAFVDHYYRKNIEDATLLVFANVVIVLQEVIAWYVEPKYYRFLGIPYSMNVASQNEEKAV